MSGAFVRAGETAADPYALEITPASAGWGFSGLRVLELPAGGKHVFDTGEDELIVLPLDGSSSTRRPLKPQPADAGVISSA